MFHRRLPREKMYFKRKFIAVPYLGRQIVLSDTKSTDPLCMFEICEYSYIYMTIYIEHMTYNRIKDKGSTLCADFEHSIFFTKCELFYAAQKKKSEIGKRRNLASSYHISAFVRSLNAFKSTSSFVICVIL